MPLCRDIRELLPEVQEKVYAAIEELNAKNIAFIVLETYREQSVQDAYYAQGREQLDVVNKLRFRAGLRPITEEENKRIITKTKRSYHTRRKAVDIVPTLSNGTIPWYIKDATVAAIWMSLADVMKKHGFEWGGDWNPKDKWGIGWDPAHYQV